MKPQNPHTENKDKQIYFLCAMPRSGNTLFASLMNQNPDIAVTANSITLEIMKELFFTQMMIENLIYAKLNLKIVN